MDVEGLVETLPPRVITPVTAATAETAPPHLAPTSPPPTAEPSPFAIQNIPTTQTDASSALLHQLPTNVEAVQKEQSIRGLSSNAAMTDMQGGRRTFPESSSVDVTPQSSASRLSDLQLDEPERARAAELDASARLAGAAAGDGVQPGAVTSFHSYRDMELPDSSFQPGGARPPSSDPIASPGIPFPSAAQPVRSTPPHPSSSSSSFNPTPVLRAKGPLGKKKKTVASTSSAFLSNPSQNLSDDSPDPMRIVPAPSASTRNTVVSKMKGKRRAPSKSASDEGPSTTNGDRSSSPRAPALSTSSRARKGKAKESRLGGATSALDGAEETVGYAGCAAGDEDMYGEDTETEDDSSTLKESGAAMSDSATVRKATKAEMSSRASSIGSSSVTRPARTFELDIVVGAPSRNRSRATSPTVERDAPYSSSHPPTASRLSPPPSLEGNAVDPSPTADTAKQVPSAESTTVETSKSSVPSSPEADSDSRPPSNKGKGRPRRSVPHFDFIVETAKKPSPPLPAPPTEEDPAPQPSSDLSSLADTMIATSPDRDVAKRTRRPAKDAGPSSDGASPKKKRRVPQAALASSSKESKDQGSAEEDEEAKEATKPDVPARGVLDRSRVAAGELKDVYSSPKRRRAVKAPVKDYSSEEDEVENENETSEEEGFEETPKKKARKVLETKGKGKGKAKEVVGKVAKPKPRRSVTTPLPSPKSTLPSPSKMLFGSQPSSSFVQQLAAKAVAPRETAAQRAKGWALGRMDKLVWVRVEKEQVQFWWPGDIINALRSERPLRIALHLDDSKEILAFAPSTDILIAEPDHTNILSFRSGAKIRFDRELFLESSDASADPVPSPELFETILKQAVEIESLRGMEDDEEDLPSSLPAPKTKGKPESEEEEEEPTSEEAAEEEQEEEDDLLRDEDESAGFTYPSVVLARSKRQWWGARLLRYETPAKDAQGKGGKPATGKFVVEWVDGTVSNVNKEDILTSSQSAFFTVKMGTTHLELPRDYVETLVEFAQDLHPIYQRIIDEDYPPATDWSNLFYQGGKSRDALAKKARFGELRDEHTEALQKEITTWASGGDGPRRTGSTRYEELSNAERSRYQADVLLPLTVFHVIIHEHDFEETATEELQEKGNAIPSEDDVMIRAFALADDEFDRGSVQKAILSARSAKQAANSRRR